MPLLPLRNIVYLKPINFAPLQSAVVGQPPIIYHLELLKIARKHHNWQIKRCTKNDRKTFGQNFASHNLVFVCDHHLLSCKIRFSKWRRRWKSFVQLPTSKEAKTTTAEGVFTSLSTDLYRKIVYLCLRQPVHWGVVSFLGVQKCGHWAVYKILLNVQKMFIIHVQRSLKIQNNIRDSCEIVLKNSGHCEGGQLRGNFLTIVWPPKQNQMLKRYI